MSASTDAAYALAQLRGITFGIIRNDRVETYAGGALFKEIPTFAADVADRVRRAVDALERIAAAPDGDPAAGRRHPAVAIEKAVRVIGGAFQEAVGDNTWPRSERFARAVVARLAGHEPPLLICFPDEIKEQDGDEEVADGL